jgi:hypothetical protein
MENRACQWFCQTIGVIVFGVDFDKRNNVGGDCLAYSMVRHGIVFLLWLRRWYYCIKKYAFVVSAKY